MSVTANNALSKLVKLKVFNGIPKGALVTLLHTVANSDANGVVNISQARLSKEIGRDRKTVGLDIKALEEIKFNGSPLAKRVDVIIKGKKHEVIKINDIFLTKISNGDNKIVDVELFIEEANENKLTAKDIANLFVDLYKEEYGISYVVNWSRDSILIKKGLLRKFADDELVEIITVAVKEYAKRWYRKDYPRPTLPMLSNWLSKSAADIVSQRRTDAKTVKRHNERRKKTEAATNDKLKGLFGE